MTRTRQCVTSKAAKDKFIFFLCRDNSSTFSTGNKLRSSVPDLGMGTASEFEPVTLTVASVMKVVMGIPFPTNDLAGNFLMKLTQAPPIVVPWNCYLLLHVCLLHIDLSPS